jgi:hypothetical protein
VDECADGSEVRSGSVRTTLAIRNKDDDERLGTKRAASDNILTASQGVHAS